jgi:hypothetical protein
VIDQIPKLLGNTTVALDQEMRDIMEDIRRLGDTVPSVHGDKGLFKVFNLMGKEIGYIILGYRFDLTFLRMFAARSVST